MTLMPKAGRGFYSGPSEAAQHLPEGVRPDLDDPGESVVERADGEEYSAEKQRQINILLRSSASVRAQDAERKLQRYSSGVWGPLKGSFEPERREAMQLCTARSEM